MSDTLAGVMLSPLHRISGELGDVLHGLRKSWPGYHGFAEAYFSEVHEGAIKHWRKHTRVTMNLIVPVGAVRFVIYDDRQGSDTYGQFLSCKIGRAIDNYARLTVEPGLWLALQGLGPGTSLVLDIVDEEHDPVEAETRELSALPFDW